MTVIMRETQAFPTTVSQVKHHDRYATRGILCSCLSSLIYGYRERQLEETTLSIRAIRWSKNVRVEADSSAGGKSLLLSQRAPAENRKMIAKAEQSKL